MDPKPRGAAQEPLRGCHSDPEILQRPPGFIPQIPRQEEKGPLQGLFWCQTRQNWVTEWTWMLTCYGKRKPEAAGLLFMCNLQKFAEEQS